MIKYTFKFIIGFVVGSLIYLLLVWGLGTLLSHYGIVLYESESDQQRNFNIVMLLWLIISIAAGILSAGWKAR